MADPCWKGYTQVGMKSKNGKKVPNCVPADGVEKAKGYKKEEVDMIRYCPKCKKDETRSECRYGPKYWDMFSLPSTLTPNQLKYDIAQVHPTNESKEPDHEHSMARSELSTIVNAAKRLRKKMKGEGNIEAWVQSKITKAADYLDSAADYLDSGEHNVHGSMDEEKDPKGPTQSYKSPEELAKKHGVSLKHIQKQVEIGTKVEFEHTSDKKLARVTALQHLDELPDYYSRLKKMESIKEEKSCWKGYKQVGMKKKGKKVVPNCVPEQKTFSQFMESIDKSKMKCNQPKEQAHGSGEQGKSHVVKACEGGKEKIIRFGQIGVKGSPKKKGESEEYANRRKRFKARHAKNIAKGKMSAAYWADKVKW